MCVFPLYNTITMPAPPEGHIRQCQARSRVTRKRCRRWALRGASTCQFHGGRSAIRFGMKKDLFKVSGFYGKYLGPRLSERVREALNKPHDEQVSLYEELAIARATACEALKLAQPLFDGTKLNLETKALTIQTLRSAMTSVKDLVLAAARVEKDQEDKVSIKVINLIMMQVVLAVNEICGTDNAILAEAIAKAIDDKVRLPMNNKLSPVIEIDLDSTQS